jgi:bifunctional UDP-N-acetylglucosamine pyrophosphorylase/glucosamine-1-phosphate N-acetyltransferase
VDLDKPWHILEANEKWLRYLSDKTTKDQIGKGSKISNSATINGHVALGDNSIIGDKVIIEGNVWIGDNTRVTQGAIVEGMVSIGDNCLVRRYCQVEAGSAIGDHCVVSHCAEVSGVLMRNSYAYHYGEFWGVLGEAGDLGAATVCGNLRFDDGRTSHIIGGRRETPVYGANAAYLGDYVRTGVNAIIMPGVKVGPYSVIGAGTLVQKDVPERTSLFVKQEHVQNKWGPERYGW